MQTPFITFIITDYNIPRDMLRECVDSILCLSLSEDEREIIVVDDGSKEKAEDVLSEYVQSVVFIRQENQGLSVARNTGIERANGQFLQFVDGDDMLIQQQYDKVIDMLRNNMDADCVTFHFTHSLPLGNVVSKDDATLMYANGYQHLIMNNMRAAACGYVFRKEILGQLRFEPGILHEDEYFTPLMFLQAGKSIITEIPAYFYRIRQESIINTHTEEWVNRRLDNLEFVIENLRQHESALSQLSRTGLQRRVAQLTMDYIYNCIVYRIGWKNFRTRVRTLKKEGLLPLPLNHYSTKYQLFAYVSRLL